MKRSTFRKNLLLFELGLGSAEDQKFLRQYTVKELEDMKNRKEHALKYPASNPYAKKEKRRRRRR